MFRATSVVNHCNNYRSIMESSHLNPRYTEASSDEETEHSVEGDTFSAIPFDQHTWQSPVVTGVLPVVREGHSVDVIGSNQMYMFGGWDQRAWMNDLHVLDINKMKWRQLHLAGAPPKRAGHATAVVGLRLFVHGGFTKSKKWLDDLHVLDTQTLTWTQWTPRGRHPCPRLCHSLNDVGDKLYLYGGYDGRRSFDTIYVLNTATKKWTEPRINGLIPKARHSHSMTVVSVSLILFGGCKGSDHFNDFHLFNTVTLTWTQPQILGIPPPGLYGHSTTLIGDCLFVFGGHDKEKPSNDLYRIQMAGMRTTKFKWEVAGAPSGRFWHSSSLAGLTRLFIFGGCDGTAKLNDVHILDLARLTEPIRSLASNFERLAGNPELSDVTLVVDGHDIPAHRLILAVQCDYFRLMLFGKMKESTQDRIEIQGWSYEPYMALIKFLYTGCMCEDQIPILCDVVGLADMYGLNQLKAMCEDRLKNLVDVENVCFILKHADKYQAPILKNFCRFYIRQHSEKVFQTKGFEELSSSPELYADVSRTTI